jgi:Mg-chelatase subunit ChlD
MVAELHYRPAAAARGHFPGHHRSRHGGNGFEFRGHANLHDAPDARRIDVHASLRDPFGRWIVRLHNQRVSMAVAVVADLSASMAVQHKQGVLADFVESLAWSAWRSGDSFGFVGCDTAVRHDLLLPQTRARGAGTALAASLRALKLAGRSAHGLQEAHRHLPQRRALVFLLSDFHLPLADVAAVLAKLAHHEVQPVVLWQHEEFDLGAQRGFADVAEPESGQRRWLWWRPALRDRWQAAAQERRAALIKLFRAQRLSPLFIEGAFDADAVTRHFMT